MDNILSKIKTPEQVNYINSEVGHLIEHLAQYSKLQVVNPTRNLFPAIESAYDTDITGVSNPCYDESEDLSTLTDNHPVSRSRHVSVIILNLFHKTINTKARFVNDLCNIRVDRSKSLQLAFFYL